MKVRQLIDRMLKKEFLNRIDVAEAVNHSFFMESDKIPCRDSGLQVSQWGDRKPEVMRNTQKLISSLYLSDQIYVYSLFLEQLHQQIYAFTNIFGFESESEDQ
jgi:hypothetical protein